MSFSSGSSDKKRYKDKHRGSSYYKREGFLEKVSSMISSYSSSSKKYKKRKKHKSSWS